MARESIATRNLDESTPLLPNDDESLHPAISGLAPARTHSEITDFLRPWLSFLDKVKHFVLGCCWRPYYSALDRHPLLIKSITAFFVLSLGDLTGQWIEHLRSTEKMSSNLDWSRVSRFAFFGLLGAPWTHYYFYYLDYFLPPTPQPFTRTTALKVVIDQFIQAPLVLATMIVLLALMKGSGMQGVTQDLKTNYANVLIINCK
jgi:hypothetical protein